MTAHFKFSRLSIALLSLFPLASYSQEATETSPQADASNVVTAFGKGLTRQVQNITKTDLREALPGTNPLKTLEKLPGVSFQSADAFGAYEWSSRFGVRGFAQTQMGFTLDDIPLGDMSYGNHNGLHIGRAISSENIGRVALSQGAGSVGTASTSNLGGTVQVVSLAPQNKQGTTLSQTFGSNDTTRTFVRFDTGLLASDTKAYISATRQKTGKWKGSGSQDQDQLNSKLVQGIGDHKLSIFYNYSDRSETDYQDLSLQMQKRLGWDWDNYAPDWQRAVNAAKGQFTGGVTNLDDAYFLGQGLRKDHLGGFSGEIKISDNVQLKSTFYHHKNEGQGHWYTPYASSSATVPIAIRASEYTIERNGFVNDLSWELGAHTLNAGFWTERSKHGFTRNFYAVSGPEDTNRFLKNPMSTSFKQDFVTDTTQFSLQDTFALMDDRLKFNFGVKSPKVEIDAKSIVGTRASGSLSSSQKMLPQFGLNYDLQEFGEVFFSMAKNSRAFQPGVTGPFSQGQTAFNTSLKSIKPETSISTDLGYRFHAASFQGSVAIYQADFSDRLLNVAVCSGIVGCSNTFVNVGKVKTNGVEFAGLLHMTKNLSWFNSVTLNDSQYKSDYLDKGVVIPVSGKQAVNSPKEMLSTELAYEEKDWSIRFAAKYTGKRYYTYLNDVDVSGYTVASMGVGKRWKSMGFLQDLSLQLNLENMFNKRYFSTVGSNGFVNSDPTGNFATLLTGAPRQLFLTLGAKL